MKKFSILAAGAAFLSSAAFAAPVAVDLSTWTATSGGSWNVAGDNNSVTQTINGRPTIFYEDGSLAQGLTLSGTIRVNTGSDDDYIGFVLGYETGDLQATNPGFLLVEWNKGSKSGVAPGLSLQKVTGRLADGPFSGTTRANTLTELDRATSLGSTPWQAFQTYNFELVFTSSLVQVFVDDVLELEAIGSFENGAFGFYNYSQGNVTYGAITEDIAPEVPLPAAALLFAPLAAGTLAKRRTRK
jgi:opacity protein-like surface antigen